MASFPALFSGVVSLYPLTQGSRIPVQILQFSDFSEQRFKQSAELARFTLTLDDLSATDKATVVTFFETTKGSFDATWDITVSGSTYSYMAFASDELQCTEGDAGWTLTVACVQTRKN